MALPNSPPAEKPCSSRVSIISSGAARPIAEYGGSTAVSSVPAIISPADSTSAGLRPARSAYAPITTAPTGRAMNPTPNVPTDSINWPNGDAVGKNTRPIWTANKA